MSRNTWHLVKIWAVVAVPGLLLSVPMIRAIISWDLPVIVVPLLAVLATSGMAVLLRWRAHGRIRRLLRSESAEDLVAEYERMLRSPLLPNRDALLAHCCAFAYVIYGDFEAARAELKGIDWESHVPLIHADGLLMEALLCYLETGQYEEGLALARSARDMARVSSVFPGARASGAAYESYVEIGEVLCGAGTEEKIASLERKAAALPITGKLLVWWGLAAAYDQRGEHEKATAARRLIRETAPHCRAILLPANVRAA